MNLPKSVTKQAKRALQAYWSDRADVYRTDENSGVTDALCPVYGAVRCHLSKETQSGIKQTGTIAVSVVRFELYIDPEILVRQGDVLKIRHNGQTFEAVAGIPLIGQFSACIKLKVEKIS